MTGPVRRNFRSWLVWRKLRWVLAAARCPWLLWACNSHPLEQPEPAPEQQTDLLYEVNPLRQLDLLFLVDNSSSMAQEQNNLKRNFPDFMAELEKIQGGLPDIAHRRHLVATSAPVPAMPAPECPVSAIAAGSRSGRTAVSTAANRRLLAGHRRQGRARTSPASCPTSSAAWPAWAPTAAATSTSCSRCARRWPPPPDSTSPAEPGLPAQRRLPGHRHPQRRGRLLGRTRARLLPGAGRRPGRVASAARCWATSATAAGARRCWASDAPSGRAGPTSARPARRNSRLINVKEFVDFVKAGQERQRGQDHRLLDHRLDRRRRTPVRHGRAALGLRRAPSWTCRRPARSRQTGIAAPGHAPAAVHHRLPRTTPFTRSARPTWRRDEADRREVRPGILRTPASPRPWWTPTSTRPASRPTARCVDRVPRDDAAGYTRQPLPQLRRPACPAGSSTPTSPAARATRPWSAAATPTPAPNTLQSIRA